jgi:hypothetical protein
MRSEGFLLSTSARLAGKGALTFSYKRLVVAQGIFKLEAVAVAAGTPKGVYSLSFKDELTVGESRISWLKVLAPALAFVVIN